MATNKLKVSAVAEALQSAALELRLQGRVEPRLSPETMARLAEVDEATVFTWLREFETSQGKSGLGPKEKLGHRTVRVRASVFDAFLRSKEVACG